MLSENELVELLDQLKLGALHGVVSESDPVGHWPILVGDGLCLSLQSAARDEFACQPDGISVLDVVTGGSSIRELCSRFWQVHHVSTALLNRTILIGYDRVCLDTFEVLYDGSAVAAAGSPVQSSIAYDFSLAVASSLDPSVQRDGINYPVAFLPLAFDDDVSIACGWRISVDAAGQQGEFFICFLNPQAESPGVVKQWQRSEAEVSVRVKALSRSSGSAQLTVSLTLPEQVQRHLPSQVRSFDIDYAGNSLSCNSDSLVESPVLDLRVQQSLQVAADDLYVLLLEAMGVGSALHIRFDPNINTYEDFRLTPGVPFRCLSINALPVKNAELLFNDGDLLLIVNE